jgi:hypothetical protein
MSLYVIRQGSPTVMVAKNNNGGERYASYVLEHPMVFEDRELVAASAEEYTFKRMNKTYYFSNSNIAIVE